jgi:general secretion pathway protein C
MHLPPTSHWTPRLCAFALALLLGWSGVYWTLRWPQGTQANSPSAAALEQPNQPDADVRALTRLLGASAQDSSPTQPVAASSRMRLSGVVADPRGAGAAVIALDGQPPRSYRVGSGVADGLMLQSVAPGKAYLAANRQAPASVVLEVPRNGKNP